MDTGMASRSKKLLKDIFSLAEWDNRGIATGFYSKRERYRRRMGLGPISKKHLSHS